MAAIIGLSILPCIQWRNRGVFSMFPWCFDDTLVHISDTVKSKRTMWTFRHTALLTRVHSTPSSNTSELCSRLTSEMRHPTTASNGIIPPRRGPADKSPQPTANSIGRELVTSHPSSRGCCCCKSNQSNQSKLLFQAARPIKHTLNTHTHNNGLQTTNLQISS